MFSKIPWSYENYVNAKKTFMNDIEKENRKKKIRKE